MFSHSRLFYTKTFEGHCYSENLNGLTKLVVKYILNRGTSLSILYRSHQIHSQLILWFCIGGVI